MQQLREKARAKRPRVVFPEAHDRVILEAALRVRDLGIARPILVGDRGAITGLGIGVTGMKIIDPAESESTIQSYARSYAKRESFPQRAVERKLHVPLNLAAMMLSSGDADTMVAGFTYTSEDVILASEMYVGVAEGVQTPSSFFLMEVPGWEGGEDGVIAFADCSIVQNPNSEELAGIALSTASSVKVLLGWEPRVAMLSFSTKGSATHPDVLKVRRAVEIVKRVQPDLRVDGEVQVDAAIVPTVSMKKIKGDNPLGGRANVLIFPDLDAGNAGYKLVQRFAKAAAYGPVLQGFRKPVSNLSRGATVEDVIGSTTIVAAEVQNS